MEQETNAIEAVIAGRVIHAVTFKQDCVEFHHEGDLLLKLFALPKVTFSVDDMAERLARAPVAERLVNLVGRRIAGLRKDAMDDYVIAIEDFAVLTVGDGQSLSGRTGMVVDSLQGPIAF